MELPPPPTCFAALSLVPRAVGLRVRSAGEKLVGDIARATQSGERFKELVAPELVSGRQLRSVRERAAVIEQLEDAAQVPEQRVGELRDRDVLVGVADCREFLRGLELDVPSLLDTVGQRDDSLYPERLVAGEVVAGPLRPPVHLELVSVCRDREGPAGHGRPKPKPGTRPDMPPGKA